MLSMTFKSKFYDSSKTMYRNAKTTTKETFKRNSHTTRISEMEKVTDFASTGRVSPPPSFKKNNKQTNKKTKHTTQQPKKHPTKSNVKNHLDHQQYRSEAMLVFLIGELWLTPRPLYKCTMQLWDWALSTVLIIAYTSNPHSNGSKLLGR